MKKYWQPILLLAGGIASHGALAQTADTSAHALHEVVVTGVREENNRRTSLTINALSAERIATIAAPTLALALTDIPGVQRLGTGQGIGKPVVRGLYGNRVLVLLDGLKFDNQQWQDEHGLGLSGTGVGRTEVVMGPAAVLYGSEAVGGVINILGERPDADSSGLQTDVGLRYFTNTAGLSTDVGFGKNTAKGWWQVRASAENHADYEEGEGTRVLNSRFGAYNLRASLAKIRGQRQTTFHFTSSISNFGFILEDLNDFFEPDARYSRSMSGPHHRVFLNIFSVENSVLKGQNTFRYNLGLQSNLRQEDEGGGAISLNMHLISLPWSVRWTHDLGNGNELIVSGIGALERNTNYGARILVPDANMSEQGVSLFFRKKTGKWTLETGAGLSDKFIRTFETGNLNTPEKEIQPFTINRISATGLVGLAWNPDRSWTFKACAATGFRAPNLAELSSNGLHEGIYRYEIGSPSLKSEQNLNFDLTAQWHGALFSASVSAFANHFRNYIYLAPTGEDYFGFPVFRYFQSNATLHGGEASTRLTLGPVAWVNTFSLVRGKREDDEYLPFIPAPRLKSRLEYTTILGKKAHRFSTFAEFEQAFEQNRPADYETETPAYFLLNGGIRMQFPGKHPLDLNLVSRNLLDYRYFDHLSRLKNYGISEPGIDISISARITF